MPHLILEYSANISEPNFSELFQQCHDFLVSSLRTELAHCKSRAIKCPDYYLGNGNVNNAFVHVCLKIMPGRTQEILKNMSQGLMEILKKHFSDSLKTLDLQITIEVSELQSPYNKS